MGNPNHNPNQSWIFDVLGIRQIINESGVFMPQRRSIRLANAVATDDGISTIIPLPEPGGIGVMGAQGPTGFKGADGFKGPNGFDGVNGLPGVAGTPGIDGIDGIDGSDGDPGDPGVDGEDVTESLVEIFSYTAAGALNHTFTKNFGFIISCGGGGGGGGYVPSDSESTISNYGGGGGGGSIYGFSTFPGGTLTGIIGVGGSGGIAGAVGAGNNGADTLTTIDGNTHTAGGGLGGQTQLLTGTFIQFIDYAMRDNGGNSVGSIGLPAQLLFNGHGESSSPGIEGILNIGGQGGGSVLGRGDLQQLGLGPGTDGRSSGAGGGGACNSFATLHNGGRGSDGAVHIIEIE